MPNSIESAAKLYESGRLDEADSICRQILKKDQNNATALHLRGVIAYQSANYSAAVTLLGAANKLLKNNISIMFALAASHENVQQYELAISLYRKICDVNPENRPARTQLASALEKSHQYKEALAEYGLLNKKFENDPATILALSRLYAGSGCELESKRYAKKLYDLAPENADIWNDLGIVYKNIHCTIDAINCFNKSLSINENHIKSRLNLASLLQETGRNLNAAINYRHVINSTGTNSNESSRAYYNLALIYLGEGDFAAGWKNLVHRPKKFTDIPSITNLNNKRLLILGEEGLGDELTFLRFIPLLKTYGPIIEYISNPKLIPLLEQIKSIDRLHDSIPLKINDETIEQYDYYISAMDLPFILGTNKISVIPPITLTLTPQVNIAHPILKEIEEIKSTDTPILAITWRAGVQPGNDNTDKYLNKSIPIESLCAMLEHFSGTIIIVQRYPEQKEINYLKSHLSANIIDASDLNSDLLLMLQLLNSVDQYIGVSNTNMHLYGSLGKKGDVIVPFPGEWRWMHEGDSSPWYPTFSIIRQTDDHNWDRILSNKLGYLCSDQVKTE